MAGDVPVYKRIAALLKTRIAGMRRDDRLPSEADLCAEFVVSRMTINKIVDALAKEGILYRIKGSGTFVRSPPSGRPPLRFLLPCPDFFVYDCTYNLQLILRGVMRQAAEVGLDVRCVPVSRVNNPDTIDWHLLEDFDEGATVFITSMWYHKVFPFLRARKCGTVFFDLVGEAGKRYPPLLRKGLIMAVDARRLMTQAVARLAVLGRRRIGYVFENYPQDDPYNAGYRDGLDNAGLAFAAERYLYAGNYDRTRDTLMDPRNDFDALVLSSPSLASQVLSVLRESGRRLPDDVAVMVCHDHKKLIDFAPPISAVAIPCAAMGRDAVEIVAQGKAAPGVRDYQGTIYERESLRRGAGRNPNPECVPDPMSSQSQLMM